MKKYLKKNWVILLAIVAVVAFACLVMFSESKDKGNATSTSVNEWKENVNEDKYTVTLLTLSYCSYCHNFLPIITELQGEYGFELYNFEIDTISEEDSSAVTSAFDMKNFSGSVPYTVIFKKGQFVADNVGYIDKAATLNFLKNNGVIK